MNTEKFVYVTYIASTPEKIWNALLEGELTRQYWGGHENVSSTSFSQGSSWKHVDATGQGGLKVVGEVLENVPNKRLVLSWADPADAGDKSRHTRVTMEIEQAGDMVRLSVTHDQLYPEMARRISNGWPLVLSSLKSFLETNRALNIFSTGTPCKETQAA